MRESADFAKFIMATEEIQFLDDELQTIYSDIRKGIEQLSVMQGTADKKLEKYSYLTSRVSRARTAYQSFKVELRELREEEKKTWSAVSAHAWETSPCPLIANLLSLMHCATERQGA